jgi:hypothetical protein
MGRFLQIGLYTFFVAVSLLGLSFARPVDLALHRGQTEVLAGPLSSEPERETEVEAKRFLELEARMHACREDLNVRGEVVRALIEGRLSLSAAARRFRELNQERTNFDWAFYRRSLRGASDEERSYWQVIRFAENEAGLSPAQLERWNREAVAFGKKPSSPR